jgi:serine/threonine protein kinase/predicted Zn-dependent protease
MDTERWRKVESIFSRALDAGESDRQRVLHEFCADDDTLRREVETLLAQHDAAGDYLETPAFSAAAQRSPVTANALIGHYRVIRKIGSGGMGTVYEAEDIKLRRRVALKFLPDEFAEDAQWMQRFRIEARAASALNHPNICTIYEVDEVGGRQFLAMEMLEGQTLGDMVDGKPLPVKTVIDLGVQIASAIDAAHAKGIVHRDIKPANIFVTTQRQVKILDFGVAKLTALPRDEAGTSIAHRTQTGMVVGSIGYMAPEQLRGQAVDQRADIFAFGCVLYEMIAGSRAFERPSLMDTAAAILNDEPPAISDTSPDGLRGLDRVVYRCLEKNPGQRFQSAADLAFALQTCGNQTYPHPTQSAVAVTRTARWKLIVPVAVATVLVLTAGAYYLRHRSPKLTDQDTIVLADFTNSTGDPVFDGTLRQGMTVQLEQSPFLSLISEQRIQKTLALMGQPTDVHLTPALGREICQRTGSAAVLDGSIASLGTQYVLGLRAVDCASGRLLDAEQVQAARKEDVLDALSRIASRFRTRIGESLATVQQHNTPLAEATTPSLEALKLYSAAVKIHFTTDSAAAQPLYKRAIELDPNFALAYAQLSQTYGELGESDLSAQYMAKAYALRRRVSDAEKYYITVGYDIRTTGNLEDAQQQCEAWAQEYPREPKALGLPAGMIEPVFAQYEKSIEDGKKAVELDPDLSFSYYNLAGSYIFFGRFDDAERVLKLADARKLQISGASTYYQIAFLKGDEAGMKRAVALAESKPKVDSEFVIHEAFASAYSGHLRQARELSQRAVGIAQQSGQRETAAGFEAGAAVREAFFANAVAARHEAAAALTDSKDREAEYGAAFALAISGDSSQAQALADDLEKRFPEDTCVKFEYVPELRALLALNRNDPSSAVDLLQVTVPFELGIPRSDFHAFFGKLYPVYVRGQAYLALHQGSQAAAEFRKILDRPFIVAGDPVGAVARLQLARAYAMAGDRTKARAAYTDFLALWWDGDQDIPILQQARKEFAALPAGSK